MASEERQPDTAVTRPEPSLEAARGDFHQLVRILERSLNAHRAAPAVGGDGPSRRERVRFKVTGYAAFPHAPVQWIRTAGEPPASAVVGVTFLGLNGPGGALPAHYTALVEERARSHDTALRDFLDLFNHRLISLYHRAWAKYRPVIQRERHNGPTPDPLSRATAALAGERRGAGMEARRYYAGHFSRNTRSAAALKALLSDFLGCGVEVESFAGQWLSIDRRDRCSIGARGRNNRLGAGVLTGRRVWDVQSMIVLHVGPLNHSDYASLLPETARYRALARLIAAYVPAHIDVRLRFLVREAARRPPALGHGARLGRNAWLCAQAGPPLQATVAMMRPT